MHLVLVIFFVGYRNFLFKSMCNLKENLIEIFKIIRRMFLIHFLNEKKN